MLEISGKRIILQLVNRRLLCGDGKMLEWLKRHAWKACRRQKRHGGSNPPLSANTYRGGARCRPKRKVRVNVIF